MKLRRIRSVVEATEGGHSSLTLPFDANPAAANAASEFLRLRQQHQATRSSEERLHAAEQNITGLARGLIELQGDLLRGFARFEHRLKEVAALLGKAGGHKPQSMDGRSVLDRTPQDPDPESVFG